MKPFFITSLSPNPPDAGHINVGYYTDGAGTAAITITDISANNYGTIPISTGTGNVNIDVSGLTPGSYLVVLICDGDPADAENLTVN